jgi:hypothetical protein
MWETPPPGHSLGEYGPHPPARPALLALAAALLFIGDGFLPWLGWGFSVPGVIESSTRYSLWDVVGGRGVAGAISADWTKLVAVGVLCALAGSAGELLLRPVGRITRGLMLGGFTIVVLGSCLGMLTGVASFEGLSGLQGAVAARLEFGFWIGLAVATIGTIAAAVHYYSPPNKHLKPEPFVPSPWGAPPSVLPPGFTPPAEDSWAGYVNRGQTPPGYVPPSYGPPVFPRPGHITPAYLAPGQVGPMFGPPHPEIPIGESDATDASAEPTPGRLTVSESGRSTTLTVEPGQRLLVGRDADAEIRVSDRKVSERHATIERRGRGWAVQDVDALKPTRLIDPWGMHRQVRGETEIPAGQVVVGDVTITLYPDHG